MRFNFIKLLEFRKGSVVLVCAAAGLFCACMPSLGFAQQRVDADTVNRYEYIDEKEGAKRIAAFRGQRLDGDYCFRFELEHLPHRAKKITYCGMMWGSWNEVGPVTRVKLIGGVGSAGGREIELIIQNGRNAKVWSRNDDGEFERMVGDALFEPVIPGVTYSPFDLQMPFVYWDTYTYEGPGRQRSQIVQQFLMRPPVGSVASRYGIGAVRIALHDAYDALFRVDVLDASEGELSCFKVESFKKVQGQYIVKEVTLKDYATKDRTRFKVKAASVGLLIDKSVFDPCHATQPLELSESLFELL